MIINSPKSIAMQTRAKDLIPGMTQLLSKRPDRFSEGVWPGYFSRAHGSNVWDLDDNRFLDMSIGGIGATILGYADKDVDLAVSNAICLGVASSLNCPEEVELADLLLELHPWADMVRYSLGGGEAMAIAIRIARASTGRNCVAFCGYHGWHDWYLAANLSSSDSLDEHLIKGLSVAGVPLGLKGTSFPFSYNNIESLEAIVGSHGRDLAAIVLEPVRSREPNNQFLEQVAALSRECGAVFIFDEVSSGFRIICGGAHMFYGVEPDIAVFAKSIGNGYPLAAVVGRGDVMKAAEVTFISSSNWTSRLGYVAALATIRKFRALEVNVNLIRCGHLVQSGWARLAEKHSIDINISGIKPLSHFSFTSFNQIRKAFFIQGMLDRGILASTSYYAMNAHTEIDVEVYLKALDEVFEDMSKCEGPESMFSRLRGSPSAEGFQRLA